MINFHSTNRNYVLLMVNIKVRKHHWSIVDPLNFGEGDSWCCTVLIQNSPNQGDALLRLLLTFAIHSPLRFSKKIRNNQTNVDI